MNDASELSRDIAAHLAHVRERMAVAAKKAGRAPSDVRLVAVTKSKSIDVVEAASRAGQTVFGENYAQEAEAKMMARPDLEWHFIGGLQSNKVRLVAGRAKLIESVDRLKLGDEIARAARSRNIVQDILVQVHIGSEGTKLGVDPSEGADLVAKLADIQGLRVRGLMSLPPLAGNERDARAQFASLRGHLEKWRTGLAPEDAKYFTELSMGTSADFEWAILEGATLVRVGTMLFGPRERKA
ncbi:MAG: YggS family pyridoxal phosphate-dependent enzyme [Bdellovibrionota bacterium]